MSRTIDASSVRDPSRRQLVLGAILVLLAVAAVVTIAYAGLADLTEVASSAALDLLDRYGLAALLGVFLLEGAMVLYFAPSESLVPAAVVAFGDEPATVATILAIAVVGATAGQVALFVLARRAGREFLLARGWLGVRATHLERFDAWFDRWGPLAVPVSNAMVFVRGMATVPAGLSDMRLRTFLVLSAVGTLCFEAALATLTLGVLGLS